MCDTDSFILRIALYRYDHMLLDYLPQQGSGLADYSVGMRLQVPLGSQQRIGIICEIVEQSTLDPAQLKPITARLESIAVMSGDLLRLCQWMSSYYHSALSRVIMSCLPTSLCQDVRIVEEALGYVLVMDVVAQQDKRATAAQRKCLQWLAQQAQPVSVDAITQAGFAARTYRHWVDNGCLKPDNTLPPLVVAPTPYAVNGEQQAAITAISEQEGFGVHVLAGITGSGKTEVYLQVIAACLRQGKQALMLVPEIGLTPQAIARLQARFATGMAVIHSQLGAKQRTTLWMAALQGQIQLIVGTRSAVLMPLPNLGVIVVDEEHDLSYKQQSGLRYSARDVAIVRGQQSQIAVILGSATLSMESLYNVEHGRYQLHSLTQRVAGGQLPPLQVIDMRRQQLSGQIAKSILTRMRCYLDSGQQVLLFINRRGYAPVILCHACGWGAMCMKCSAKLHYHQRKNALLCHHCEYMQAVPERCVQCEQDSLVKLGMGTERLQEWATETFGDQYPIVRIDRDSTRKRGSLSRLLAPIYAKEPAILLGTQMLAKGHHFPNVNLVAILDIDSYLYSPDFRNLERMMQIVIQVAGRAGRESSEAEVVVQTHCPEHEIFTQLHANDYLAFGRCELAVRTRSQLPPCAQMALLRAESVNPEHAQEFLQALMKTYQNLNLLGVKAYGPVPAMLERVANRFRYQVLFHAATRKQLRQGLAQLSPNLAKLPHCRQVKWVLDIDPVEVV